MIPGIASEKSRSGGMPSNHLPYKPMHAAISPFPRAKIFMISPLPRVFYSPAQKQRDKTTGIPGPVHFPESPGNQDGCGLKNQPAILFSPAFLSWS